MARSRDISKVLSSNTTLATDAEVAASYLSTASAAALYAPVAAGGLVQIVPTSITGVSGTSSVDSNGLVTFSGISSISLNGCFSSNHRNYAVVLRVKHDSSTFIHINARLRASGTDVSSANYQTRTIVWGNDGGASGESRVNGTSMLIAWNQGTKNSLATFDIGDPFLSEYTNFIGNVMVGYIGNDTNQITSLTGGMLQTTTSYDGITFFPASGTASGNVKIYGYKN
jgi:hypothetical protein